MFFIKHLILPSCWVLVQKVSTLKSVELNVNDDGIGSMWLKPPYSETVHKVAVKYVVYIHDLYICVYKESMDI